MKIKFHMSGTLLTGGAITVLRHAVSLALHRITHWHYRSL